MIDTTACRGGTHAKSSQLLIRAGAVLAALGMPPPLATFTGAAPNAAQMSQIWKHQTCSRARPRPQAHQHDLHGAAKLEEVAGGVAAGSQRHQVGLQQVTVAVGVVQGEGGGECRAQEHKGPVAGPAVVARQVAPAGSARATPGSQSCS